MSKLAPPPKVFAPPRFPEDDAQATDRDNPAAIDAQRLVRLAGQQVPGEFDVPGSERLVVMPDDVGAH